MKRLLMVFSVLALLAACSPAPQDPAAGRALPGVIDLTAFGEVIEINVVYECFDGHTYGSFDVTIGTEDVALTEFDLDRYRPACDGPLFGPEESLPEEMVEAGLGASTGLHLGWVEIFVWDDVIGYPLPHAIRPKAPTSHLPYTEVLFANEGGSIKYSGPMPMFPTSSLQALEAPESPLLEIDVTFDAGWNVIAMKEVVDGTVRTISWEVYPLQGLSWEIEPLLP